MPTAEGRKKLGTDLPADFQKAWAEWCKANGLQKSAAAEAALRAFQVLPVAVRALALAGQWDQVMWCLGADVSAEAEVKLLARMRRILRRPPPFPPKSKPTNGQGKK